MSEEEEWSTPQSSSLEEASMELGIEPISEPEIGSTLTEVNQLVRKNGLSCIARDETVNKTHLRPYEPAYLVQCVIFINLSLQFYIASSIRFCLGCCQSSFQSRGPKFAAYGSKSTRESNILDVYSHERNNQEIK